MSANQPDVTGCHETHHTCSSPISGVRGSCKAVCFRASVVRKELREMGMTDSIRMSQKRKTPPVFVDGVIRKALKSQTLSWILQHVFHQLDRCRSHQNHEDPGEDEQNEREDHLHGGLLSLLFRHLTSLYSHAVRLNSQRLGD